MNVAKILPRAAFAAVLIGVATTAAPPPNSRGIDATALGRLPVLEGGRIKPLDSVARNSLLVIRSQQTFRTGGVRISAIEWLLDVMFRPAVADEQPVFVIDDPDVLAIMNQRQSANRYFSFHAIQPYLGEISNQAATVHAIDAKQRTPFQSAINNLYERLFMYHRLRHAMQVPGGPTLNAMLAAPAEAGQASIAMTELTLFRAVPPKPGEKAEAWKSIGESLTNPAEATLLGAWAALATAYASQSAAYFNHSVGELTSAMNARVPGAMRAAGSEQLFNRVEPFYVGMVIYVLALLTLFVSWLWKPEILQPTAYSLLLGGAVVHTLGLIARIVLQGRPPVTNLYSSAVFVGWAAVVLGVILERMYRRGFGTLVAATAGFVTLIVAHHLATDGDTMEMMRAVLDSNFWLATHVVTITIGYSGTFLAGTVAIVYSVRKHLTRTPDPVTTSNLVSMAYGIVAFSLILSFVGTVLGGIWADQSWGRFWGWDPKENGALLIVLWNAVILHARWGGFVKEKGIMAMAIFGNIITSLSWFGVNMLGVGLHSYGFMDKAFWSLSAFIATQLILIAICIAPARFRFARANLSA
jgi:ABC-type transport system involved in cytochrome c biogenesis permease subunit